MSRSRNPNHSRVNEKKKAGKI